MEHFLVLRRASDRELYAGSGALHGVLYAGSSREANNGVDVEFLVGYEAADGFYLCGLQLASEHCEYVSVFALAVDPVLVLLHGDGVKAYVDAHLAGLEEQVFHHTSGVVLIHSYEDAEGESGVDIGLAYVLDVNIVACQYLHDAGCESWAVFARDAYEDKFFHGKCVMGE